MCSGVASLTGEMAARSFAYHAHGTADSITNPALSMICVFFSMKVCAK